MRYLLLRLKRFCGFVTGLVFVIGGILKLLDPVGTGLIMDGYLDFLHLGFLGFSSKILGTAFAFAETIIGTGLITGVWRKPTALAAMAMQGFFTFLTLLLVIFNPSMDCGCFGEAIHLTHMETFLKNIVLCILLAAYYFPPKQLGQNKRRKYVSFAAVTASILAFTIYSWMYIPLVDFTDFKPAAALRAGHEPQMQEELYEAVFIYEKDGVQEEFDLDNLPDSTWTFVSTETVAKNGNKAETLLELPIHDAEGVQTDSLAAEGKVMTVSIYKTRMSARKWNRTAAFLEQASAAGFRTLVLAASTPEKMEDILAQLPAETASVIKADLYYSDYKTLLTMNRSNAGVTYFSEGYLISKWARRTMPDKESLDEIFHGDDTEVIIDKNTRGNLTFQGFLLYVFAVMLLL